MIDDMGDWKRTHDLGQLRLADQGQEVTLMAWVHRRRDHGGLIFLDLRDREGLTQVVFYPELSPTAHAKAHQVRSEFVVAVHGIVNPAAGGDREPGPAHRPDRGAGHRAANPQPGPDRRCSPSSARPRWGRTCA